MAPSSGHLLVPKVMRIAKFAISKTTTFIRSKLPSSTTTSTSSSTYPLLQPIRLTTHSLPLHPLARLRQSRAERWLHSTHRDFSSTSKVCAPYDRCSFSATKVGRAVRQRGSVPFASTLRPNLTGGALPRTAGGYSLGGTGRGVRHFSQTPSCQAQVIQNVNAGVRAFFVGGGKARFDGVDPITGEKRFKSVKAAEEKVLRTFDAVKPATFKGTNLEFRLSPTITALLPSKSFENQQSLSTESLLEALSTDFAHALRTLSLTLSDLKRLSALGSLPISTTSTPEGPVLSVRFPGCDAETVTLLCEELGIFSGIVRQDAEWDDSKEVEMALLFPFAPTGHYSPESDTTADYFEQKPKSPQQLEWQGMMTPSTNLKNPSSTMSYDHLAHPLMSSVSPSGYESMHSESAFGDEDPYLGSRSARRASEDFHGIMRFMRECEEARR